MGEYADMFINDQIDKACKVGDTEYIPKNVPVAASLPPLPAAAGLNSRGQPAPRPWSGVGDPTPRKSHISYAGTAQPWNQATLPKGLDQMLVGEIATCSVCNMGNLKVSLDLGKLRLRDENGFWHGCDPTAKALTDEIQLAKDIPF